MSSSALGRNLLPKQEQERIGIWVVGPPGCGKTAVCRTVRGALFEWDLHVVDSDDACFQWAMAKTPEVMARTISDFCQDLATRPILACSVEGPPDHDRWIVFGIDRPILECMRARPEAYVSWISGKEQGARAIDSWQASGTVHHVLRGSTEEMAQQVVNRIRQTWACST